MDYQDYGEMENAPSHPEFISGSHKPGCPWINACGMLKQVQHDSKL
jgi:hypothetical protein